MQTINIDLKIPESLNRSRLDAAVAELIPEHSRSRIQQWIKDGSLSINGKSPKSRDKVLVGDQITIRAQRVEQVADKPQDIDLDVLFSDADIIVLNKPVGLVTHPAAGNHDGTLLNALLFHFPELAQLPRAGIIHRLDKDTSGVMVVARNLQAHTHLVNELQLREVHREYLALLPGHITAGGTIDAPVGRHPKHRLKMAVIDSGKPAVTHFRIAERLPYHTLLRVNLETGRTHQIRVHLEHQHFPIIGDQLYGQLRIPKGASLESKTALENFRRQALHAHKLGLKHPTSGKPMEFVAPLPKDMDDLLVQLRKDKPRI